MKLDRMAADCAVELKEHNVACVSLWPGAVLTELMDDHTQSEEGKNDLVRIEQHTHQRHFLNDEKSLTGICIFIFLQ